MDWLSQSSRDTSEGELLLNSPLTLSLFELFTIVSVTYCIGLASTLNVAMFTSAAMAFLSVLNAVLGRGEEKSK